MPQDPAPMDQLRDEPLRFLETEQFPLNAKLEKFKGGASDEEDQETEAD